MGTDTGVTFETALLDHLRDIAKQLKAQNLLTLSTMQMATLPHLTQSGVKEANQEIREKSADLIKEAEELAP